MTDLEAVALTAQPSRRATDHAVAELKQFADEETIFSNLRLMQCSENREGRGQGNAPQIR